MKAHTLAKLLFACPDYEVQIDGFGTEVKPISAYAVEYHAENGSVDMVVCIETEISDLDHAINHLNYKQDNGQ